MSTGWGDAARHALPASRWHVTKDDMRRRNPWPGHAGVKLASRLVLACLTAHYVFRGATAAPAAGAEDHGHEADTWAGAWPASGRGGLPSRGLAAAPPALDASATRRVQRDGEPDPTVVPQPQLYYQGDLLIWAPQDTLARDVLARRPEVWLCALLAADYEGAALLPHFLEHYARLGIATDRMLFVVNHTPRAAGAAAGAGAGALAHVTALLDAFGADYRVWLGQYTPEAYLGVQLRALARVPVQDWVLAASGDELHDYGGLTAQLFLERREREGANWVRAELIDRVATSGRLKPVAASPPALASQFPLRCHLERLPGNQEAAAGEGTVAAFRAFLRPGLGGRGIVPPELAKSYYESGSGGGGGNASSPLCGTTGLHELTPYARFWQYYRTPTMVGNAFLWYARVADTQAKVHRFTWHAGADRALEDQVQYLGSEHSTLCAAAAPGRELLLRELERLVVGVVRRGSVDVNDASLGCALAPRLPRLPLSEPAARALVRVKRAAAQQAVEAEREAAAAVGGVERAREMEVELENAVEQERELDAGGGTAASVD